MVKLRQVRKFGDERAAMACVEAQRKCKAKGKLDGREPEKLLREVVAPHGIYIVYCSLLPLTRHYAKTTDV